MRVIIAGSREFTDYEMLKRCVEQAVQENKLEITEIVSGKAHGADTLGEQYAKEKGIPVKEFPADWDKFGKSAGYIRNEQMAKYADWLIAFWRPDCKGTTNMIKIMRDLKKPSQVFEIPTTDPKP
jgi:hypothetical protein